MGAPRQVPPDPAPRLPGQAGGWLLGPPPSSLTLESLPRFPSSSFDLPEPFLLIQHLILLPI